MDNDAFWSIVESAGLAGNGDRDRFVASLRDQLKQLPPTDIGHFQQILDEKIDGAYTWNLWGAGYVLMGGCSDDGFLYFRGWIVSRGRAIYDAAVADADSLATLVSPEMDDADFEFEDILYIAQVAFEEVTKTTIPSRMRPSPPVPAGERWDVDDENEVAKRLPQLSSVTRY